VIGYTVSDRSYGEVGKLIAINDSAAQELLVITHESGKEVLIPLVDELFLGVDREQKVLTIDAPEGLIALYLS
jgi:16S rRNA processing protein RimM